MIEENGRIVEIDGAFAWVETARRSSCSSCSAKSGGCGTGALSEVLGARNQRLKVRNDLHAQSGEQVVLGIEESALLRGSLAVYIVPLFTLMGGALLGEMLAPQWNAEGEWPALFGGLAGLGLGLLWLRRFNYRAGGDPRYQPRMLRRLGAADVQLIQPIKPSEE